MKLQKLELNAFRGATKPFELPFHSSKKLTMVFGENGTGKSTIADAFTCHAKSFRLTTKPVSSLTSPFTVTNSSKL